MRILRIILVDDHEVVREGLRSALRRDPRFDVVGDASSGAEALALAETVRPDVAVVDLRLDDMSGQDLCTRLRERDPALHVVIVSTFISEDTVRSAKEAGASAYVAKSAGLPPLRDALEAVRQGESTFDVTRITQNLNELAERRLAVAGLTPRQQRVLELAADGLTDRQIGEKLFISESTVRFHVQKLKAMLGANSKTDLVARAIRTGIIEPADQRRPD